MGKVLKGVEGAMKGYRPQVDWGGEEGNPTIKVGGHNVQVGTAGWRRRCLFILLLALLVLSIINFVLTLWLLRRISFNVDGAGSLKILSGGVKLDGTITLQHDFSASNIRGQISEVLNISGYHNISIGSREKEDKMAYGVVLDGLGVTAIAKELRLSDKDGTSLFNCDDRETFTDAKFFTVTGERGADFYGSLESPVIQGDDVHEFKLESQMRRLEGSAGELLRLEARDGDVTTIAFNDVTLTSEEGKFHFDSPNVFIPQLPIMDGGEAGRQDPTATEKIETQIPAPDLMFSGDEISSSKSSFITREELQAKSHSQTQEEDEGVEIFQLCVCPSGRLFLADADSVCIPDEVTCR